MKNILNDEQYKKWETMLEKRARSKNRMKRGKRMEEKKLHKELSKD